MKYIFIVALGLIITTIYYIILAKKAKKIAEKPFVCSECGHKFFVKWYKLLGNYNEDRALYNGMSEIYAHFYLKCPNCKTKSRCKHPWDEE